MTTSCFDREDETFIVLVNHSLALAAPEAQRVSPLQTWRDRQRIRTLERDLRHKDKALATGIA